MGPRASLELTPLFSGASVQRVGPHEPAAGSEGHPLPTPPQELEVGSPGAHLLRDGGVVVLQDEPLDVVSPVPLLLHGFGLGGGKTGSQGSSRAKGTRCGVIQPSRRGGRRASARARVLPTMTPAAKRVEEAGLPLTWMLYCCLLCL